MQFTKFAMHFVFINALKFSAHVIIELSRGFLFIHDCSGHSLTIVLIIYICSQYLLILE